MNLLSEVEVLADAQGVAYEAASWIAERLHRTPERELTVCLTGGNTVRLLYRVLAATPFSDTLPWHRIHWFWTDERFVPQGSERSNSGMARKLLLKDVNASLIHAIPTDTSMASDAAADYEHALKKHYGASVLAPDRNLFDLTLLGVGDDGHIASLFPESEALNERNRWVVPVHCHGAETRVSLTYSTLESSDHVLFLVTGSGKRRIMQAITNGADLPVTRFRPRGVVQWFLDRDAAPEGLL